MLLSQQLALHRGDRAHEPRIVRPEHGELGQLDGANQLFERLAKLCNDVGLLSEEYDPRAGRMTGNFPQAFSHLALVNTACNLSSYKGPGEHRALEPALEET